MSKSGDGFNIDKMAGGSNELGSIFIDTTAVTWGKFQYLVVNADCVFTVLTTNLNRDCLLGHEAIADTNDYNDGLNLAGQTVTKGMIIYPPKGETFLNITLSSGSVLAYG